jgi:hypothetical protein
VSVSPASRTARVAYIRDVRGQLRLYSFCRTVTMSFVREQSVERAREQSGSSAWNC